MLPLRCLRGGGERPLGEEILPPPTSPYSGEELIIKRFPRLCKEGLGVVV